VSGSGGNAPAKNFKSSGELIIRRGSWGEELITLGVVCKYIQYLNTGSTAQMKQFGKTSTTMLLYNVRFVGIPCLGFNGTCIDP
jgi:hypothetical protein